MIDGKAPACIAEVNSGLIHVDDISGNVSRYYRARQNWTTIGLPGAQKFFSVETNFPNGMGPHNTVAQNSAYYGATWTFMLGHP